MRCYLIAERPTDLSVLRAVLTDLEIEIVEPARAFDTTSQVGRGWLPDVDFVCALFPAGQGWETPAALYLEIGEAVGAGIPVLLVAEPPRRLDTALLPLPVVRVPIAGKGALASQIRIFLHSVGRRPAPVAAPRAPDGLELETIRGELAALRDAAGPSVHGAPQRVEDLALQLLRAAGAEAQATTGTEGVGDFAAWVPGTERFIPGPLLVEVKILRDGRIDRAILDQLQLYALTRDAQWSIFLYYRWDPNRRVHLPTGGAWPTVMVFDIEELVSGLREKTLAQIINNERNAIVHGVEPQ